MGATFPQHYKIFYMLYNIAYFSIGVVMLAFGIATLLNFLSFGSFTGMDFVAASGLFIAVGGLKIILSALGVVSFFVKWKPLFAVYVILSVLLMLTTYAAAIVAFLNRPSAHTLLGNRLNTIYTESIAMNNTQEFMDLQTSLDCCGPTRDFNDTIGNCVTARANNTVFGRGCLQPLSDQVLDRLYNLGALGMAFGSFELTTFLIAIQHTEGSGL